MTDTKALINELLAKGQELNDLNQDKEAIKLYKTALVMSKKFDKYLLGTIYIKLANSYYNIENVDKYIYYYEQYLYYFPEGQASIFSRLAHAYYYIDSDKCIDYHNKALNLSPSEYNSVCKLFAMIKSSYYDQSDIKDESELEVEKIRNEFYKNVVKYNHTNKKQLTNKKLNIGYLSSDCYTHTMMNYIIPIWENHNRDEFNIFIFNGASQEDITTEKINNLGYEIIKCSEMDNEEIAKVINEKDIDILVDLGGYTHLKSYSAFYKPAPIIISYLGYLNTLGIKEVDYILTDRYTIPEDKAFLYTEKPLYLDTGYQVFNYSSIPDIEDNPYKTNGYITFGSFNCTSKFNDLIIYIWCKILEEVENSKLLIYRTQLNTTIIKHLKSKFKKWGISEDRIIYSNSTFSTHYKAYSQVDIALDTYPFSGMSIAIESALMGVPTVTLLGEGMQSRGAGRINEIIGHSELNATCGQEYIEIASMLANDKNKLDEIRKHLRESADKSTFKTEPSVFTKDLEDKYKKAWELFINTP